ncbi:MAG: hypothetical protein H0V64_10590 [Geodermatophilaceae bacterium]|nr:hypothetical protein [Geodermatophilaceae bacterium]
MDLQSARELKSRLLAHVSAVASDPAVEPPVPRGFAVGIAPRPDGAYAVAIRLTDETAAADSLAAIAEQFGDDLDFRTVGEIRPLRVEPDPPDVKDLQARQRPIYPGLSVGHPDVTAGTLGGFVSFDGRRLHLLSNSHVLAESGQARLGDAVLQPGVADGGDPAADAVGTLASFVPLDSAEPNLVDAAVAVVAGGIDADPSAYPGGPVGCVATAPPADGLVQKVGRTTGLTSGRVTAFEVDGLMVQYDVGVLTFDNQIEIEGADAGPFSAGGDSGSVIWTTTDRHALGLLFAGSTTGGQNGQGLTYANPLALVLSELGATWVSETSDG